MAMDNTEARRAEAVAWLTERLRWERLLSELHDIRSALATEAGPAETNRTDDQAA